VERFWNERSAAFCSGFKVGNKLIATAGHCIETPGACKATRFIFGFYKTRAKLHPELNIPRTNVYSCKRIVAGVTHPDSLPPDWRVVEVDRNIAAPQVTIRPSTIPRISRGTGVTVIGYPNGLPVKIVSGAKVLEVSTLFHAFLINADAYHGNFGSAVFNTARLAQGQLFVEGILNGGNPDFVALGSPPCAVSRHYPKQGGGASAPFRGEFATFASEIEKAR